ATPTSVVISTAPSGSDTNIEEKEDLSYAEKRRHFKKTSSLSEVTTDSKLKDSIRRDTATEGKGERGLAKSQRTSITFDASTGPAWSDDMSLPSTRHSASLDGPVFATPTTITKDELAFHVINNDFEHPLAKALFKFKCSTLAERDQWMKSLDKARQNLCSNSSAADVDEDDLLKLLPSPTSNLHPSPRKFASFRKKSASRNGSIIQPRQRFSQNRQSTAFASTREVKTRSATLASDIFRDAGVPDERRNTADLSRSWEQELKERHRSASLLSSPSSAAFSSSLSAGISLPSVEELSHGSPAADLLDGKTSYRESVNLQLLFQKSNSNDRFAASPLADRRSTEEEGRLYTSQLNSGQTSRRSLFRRNALSSKSKYKMEKQFREEIMQTCEDLQQKLMFLEEENAALKRRLLSTASVDASLEDEEEEEEEEESSWEIESAAVEGKRQERKEEGSEEDEKSEEDSTKSEKLGNEKRENSALKDENKRLRTVNARLRKQLITLQEEIENERRIFRSQSVQRVMDLLTYKKELERMAETEGESPLGASDEDSDTQPRNGEGGDTIKRHDKKREKKDKKKEKKAKTKKKEKKGKHATLDRIPEETKSDKWQALRKKLIEAEGADASASQKTKVVQRVAFYEGWAQNNSCENLRQFFDKFSADPNFLRTGKSNASANNNNPRTTKSASRQTTLK
ncbi:CHZ domain-containing protein, partial [Balamuthia mandrillaris]